MSDTLERLKQAIAESNITQVAEKIGVPRPTLSLVLSGKYGVKPTRPQGANPKKILERFEKAYGGVNCPHLKADLTLEQCLEFATKARPSNPLGLAHWKACRNCEHNPNAKKEQK